MAGPVAAQGIIYVNTNNPSGGNGLDWLNAYKYLQDALADANSKPWVTQIWVATGTYYPDANDDFPGGTGDREATFQLVNGVALYGGFAGGETSPQERDLHSYHTILSGDIGTVDVNLDNSYHVVTGSGTDGATVLDGFVVTAGNANGPIGYHGGGGVYNNGGHPTITKCAFINNLAYYGAGVFNDHSSPTIINCLFGANLAEYDGGAVYNYNNSSPALTNCAFFNGNSAHWGGAMCNDSSSSPTLTNCTFSGNTATNYAGGIYNLQSSSPMLTNCILWGNSDSTGFSEAAQMYNFSGSSPFVTYSCIQGYSGSEPTNTNVDPEFVNADGYDNIAGTPDDNLRLLIGSPCINAGDNNALPADVATDLDGNLRFVDSVVDMGVYEGENSWIGQKIVPSDAANGRFGASVSIDADYAIVGKPWDDHTGVNSGSAYIFKRSGTNWTEQAKLTASDASDNDYFGTSVSIHGDYAIVGAYGADCNGISTGATYIFHRDGNSWTEQTRLIAADGANGDHFGTSVSINQDICIIGADCDDDNGTNSGSAYIFEREGTNWIQRAKVAGLASTAYFGNSVSICGNYAIVGEPLRGAFSGLAYIFAREDGDPNIWSQKFRLSGRYVADYHKFGTSVFISSDYAIVGAPGDDTLGASSGAAYIFKRSGTSWIEANYVIVPQFPKVGAAGDYFGESVSINENHAIIGAPWDDNNGSIYLFKRTKRTGNIWGIQDWYEKIAGHEGSSKFGCSVAISGNYAIVGDSSDASAYVFKGIECPSNDLNGDCRVDFIDFSVFARQWLDQGPN